MISKRDLRLGNVFEQGVVCKINGRTGAKVHLYGRLRWDRNRVKVIESLDVSDLKPIILTPKILTEWCGYNDMGDFFMGSSDKLYIHIHLKLATDGFQITWDGGKSVMFGGIRYLHELQNLFYAFNKAELDIKGY